MAIGCAGAGKSTFSLKLHEVISRDVIHFDQYYWKPYWVETEPAQWLEVVTKLADRPEWIMDGNYGDTFDIRLERADTVFYLDCPTWKCLWRITRRILKYYGRVRPDMPEGCRERFDWPFYHYVLTYNLRRRRKMLELLNSLEDRKRIVILNSSRQIDSFLQSLHSR